MVSDSSIDFSKNILVCGGAGYVGSHVALSLMRSGYTPVIVDNFANSDPSIITRLEAISRSAIKSYKVDLADKVRVFQIFEQVAPVAVIQLAGLKAVAQSFKEPVNYYAVNLGITLNILSAMSHYECEKIVFSSSATVYGEPDYIPIDEGHRVSPINPYGRTKLFQEEIIRDWVAAEGQASAVILRYFNPVGADASGLIGEDPSGTPNNLMPILGDTAAGIRDDVLIFGADYPTRDGTCERDYVHVSDVADAHVAALEAVLENKYEIFNVGTGRGVTVREAIDAYSKALGQRLPKRIGARRDGDAASSVAANNKILQRLKWRPLRDFKDACRDEVKWRSYKAGQNLGD
ncbi:UDP-glucose 4-epimerase GalE [Roseobacter sp. HKCCA0882]|uniref:UDP-glucose 4-epimerase GalE n=1 Tax=Roseobacter sp. HKCCA0882 TaxID=3120337 RepID=UPI0030EC2ABF